MIKKISISWLITCSQFLLGQTYYWSGSEGDSNFFNENNWYEVSSGEPPENGSIDPNQVINFDLHITCQISVQENLDSDFKSIILESSKTLHITNGSLNALSFSGGTLNLNESSYVNLHSNQPLSTDAKIKLSSNICWLRLNNVPTHEAYDLYSSQISVADSPVEYPANIRFDNYYNSGVIIRPHDSNLAPLTIYSQEDFDGLSNKIPINQIYSGNEIPNQLNNNIESFRLARGYMLTIAENDEGTGQSKVFIASETDLHLKSISNNLKNKISFLRVIPWNWVSKKGTAGDISGLKNTWYYKWSNNGNSDLNREYSPMSWGHNATDNDDITSYINKYKVTHVMGFNEPDDCNNQSGQYGDLCQENIAVEYYKNLMKTGLRLVSPACRQEGVTTWLKNFNNLAIQNDVRIDVIAVHWYDWNSNPQNSINANPIQVFNRFKQYLENVYNIYGLPIWITEFNANKHRTKEVNEKFLELALPYLDSLYYIERYAWFQPHGIPIASDPGTGEFFNENDPSQLTDIGVLYKNHLSTPSIPKYFYESPNNLNDDLQLNHYQYTCDNSNFLSFKKSQKKTNGYFKLIPNPAEDYIELDLDEPVEDIYIFNINGIMILKLKANKLIDISELKSGIYLVKAGNNYTKLIKN